MRGFCFNGGGLGRPQSLVNFLRVDCPGSDGGEGSTQCLPEETCQLASQSACARLRQVRARPGAAFSGMSNSTIFRLKGAVCWTRAEKCRSAHWLPFLSKEPARICPKSPGGKGTGSVCNSLARCPRVCSNIWPQKNGTRRLSSHSRPSPVIGCAALSSSYLRGCPSRRSKKYGSLSADVAWRDLCQWKFGSGSAARLCCSDF